MSFLNGEEQLLVSNNSKVVVTNYRVSLSERYLEGGFFISIFLEDISSIETKYKSNVLWVIPALLCFLFGLYNMDQMYTNGREYLGFILGALFLFFWWASKKHLVRIGSKGGSPLEFVVEHMPEDQVQGFTEVVMNAKLKRINDLKSLIGEIN